MTKISSIIFCALLTISHAADWAVLVAGSNGFWNYRHQADVAHAYQDLVKGGFNPENIITLMYDDIAGDSSNPFPGKIFNKPSNGTGRDVYAGVKIDYKGVYVTSKNFLGVLTGKPAFAGAKVLKSGPEDNIFVFFSDHGGPGLICFPSDDLLAADLINALTEMHANKMYKKFVFYLESCESGSMFDGLLNANLGIYAVTAANKAESSWGTYCSPNDVVDNKHIGSCLGDLFSISWMEDVDVTNTHKETLEEQFHKVVARTNLSHVSRFGDLSYTSDVLAEYIAGPTQKENVESISLTSSNVTPYDAKLAMLNWRVQEVQRCRCVHPLFGDIKKVTAERDQELFERGRSSWIFTELWSRMTNSKEGMLDKSLAPRNFECLGQVRNAYRQYCGPISDYAQQFSRAIVNLCETGRTTETLVSALSDICRL